MYNFSIKRNIDFKEGFNLLLTGSFKSKLHHMRSYCTATFLDNIQHHPKIFNIIRQYSVLFDNMRLFCLSFKIASYLCDAYNFSLNIDICQLIHPATNSCQIVPIIATSFLLYISVGILIIQFYIDLLIAHTNF